MSFTLSSPFAFDLGAQNTLVMGEKKTIDAYIPSVVIKDAQGGILFVGEEALSHLPDVPASQLFRCTNRGQITDTKSVEALLQSALHTMHRTMLSRLIPSRCLIAVSSTFSPAQAQVYKAVFKSQGFLPAFIPSSVGIGMVAATRKKQSMQVVADFGASKVEIAVLDLGRVVRTASLSWGGEKLDCLVASHLLSVVQTVFPMQDITSLKHTLSPWETKKEQSLVIRGKHTQSGKVVSHRISSSMLLPPFSLWIEIVANWMRCFLSDLPTGMLSTIQEHGISIAGGLCQLSSLEPQLKKLLDVPIFPVSRPQVAACMGIQSLVGLGEIQAHFIS